MRRGVRCGRGLACRRRLAGGRRFAVRRGVRGGRGLACRRRHAGRQGGAGRPGGAFRSRCLHGHKQTTHSCHATTKLVLADAGFKSFPRAIGEYLVALQTLTREEGGRGRARAPPSPPSHRVDSVTSGDEALFMAIGHWPRKHHSAPPPLSAGLRNCMVHATTLPVQGMRLR